MLVQYIFASVLKPITRKDISSNMNKKKYRDEVPPFISVPASMQSQSLPHSTRHSEPRRQPTYPKRALASYGQPHHPQRKAQTHAETNLTSQKPDRQWVNTRNLSARLLTGGNQSPRTQTPPAEEVRPPPKPTRPQWYHRICPVQAPPNPAHGQKDQKEGTSSLTIYKNLHYVQV